MKNLHQVNGCLTFKWELQSKEKGAKTEIFTQIISGALLQ